MNNNENPFINQPYNAGIYANQIVQQAENQKIQYANDNIFNENDIYHNLSAGKWVQSHEDINDVLKQSKDTGRKIRTSDLVKSFIFIGIVVFMIIRTLTAMGNSNGNSTFIIFFLIVFSALILIPVISNIFQNIQSWKPDETFSMDNAVAYRGYELMESCGLKHSLMYKLPSVVRRRNNNDTTSSYYIERFNIDNFITKPDNETKWYIIYARIRNYSYNIYGNWITSNVILETQGTKARLLIPNNPAIMMSIIAYMGFTDSEDTITYIDNNAYMNDVLDENQKNTDEE